MGERREEESMYKGEEGGGREEGRQTGGGSREGGQLGGGAGEDGETRSDKWGMMNGKNGCETCETCVRLV